MINGRKAVKSAIMNGSLNDSALATLSKPIESGGRNAATASTGSIFFQPSINLDIDALPWYLIDPLDGDQAEVGEPEVNNWTFTDAVAADYALTKCMNMLDPIIILDEQLDQRYM
jgi:hypothetical protein